MLRSCLLLLVAAFGLTGCIGIERPDAEVVSVRLDEQSAGGGRMIVAVRIDNPNDEDLPMPRVSYQVDVIGAGQFAFTDIPYAVVPRGGQQTIELPAAMRGAAFSGKAYKVEGTIVFEPDGDLRRFMYDAGVPLPRTSFSSEGVLE